MTEQATESQRRLGVFSPRLLALPALSELLDGAEVVPAPTQSDAAGLTAVVVASGFGEGCARRFAREHGLPMLRMEHGPIRTLRAELPALSWSLRPWHPKAKGAPDERLLASDWTATSAQLATAERCISLMREGRVSRDNHAPPLGPLPSSARERVWVVDQPRSDGPREVTGADFADMLDAARREHPGAELIVALPADARAPFARGYLTKVQGGTHLGAVHPSDLLGQVDHVYTLDSFVGFEALIAGKPVTCCAPAWYAGWGLTFDRHVVEAPRGKQRSLAELFVAHYLEGVRYVHPETGSLCDLEELISIVALQRRAYERNAGNIFCFGFYPWKMGYVRDYLRSPGNRVTFAWRAFDARARGFSPSSNIVVWGLEESSDVRALAEAHGVPIWRMEDGFLRSVGLGSDRTVPASLVLDKQGIYFDPNGPSDLESILEHTRFSDAELERAKKLRQLIVSARVSKYNVGDPRTMVQRPADGRRVLLVPGQVEDDASIRLGCVDIRTNEALLRAVRERAPDAFIIFKPHPDVISGNRRGAVAPEVARALADVVVVDSPLPACLDIADEVHTMTSLVGFEALLRGLHVSVYGRPFYAGWGLTEDRHVVERRTRKLTLDELVAGTLLRYPLYLSPRTGLFTTPERVIDELRRSIAGGTQRIQEPVAVRKVKKAWNAVRGMLDAF